jgi:carbonic anhydrase
MAQYPLRHYPGVRAVRIIACVALLLLPMLTAAAAAGTVSGPAMPPHWQYHGTVGPEHWGDLTPDFVACRDGRSQSPIDIVATAMMDAPALATDYISSPVVVTNTGHTIQVTPQAAGHLTVDNKSYRLLQFHFHSPAEEHIDGESFPLGVHFVHGSEAGELLVVAVLIREGEENTDWQAVFTHLPEGQEAVIALEMPLDISRLIPLDKGFYSFMGSLTTPPCSEGVRWFVMKEVVSLSAAQIGAFTGIYPMNARPLQPRHGREVMEWP